MDFPHLLAVHRAMNLTFLRWKKLNSIFAGDWQKVFTANIRELQRAEIDTRAITSFLQKREEVSPEKEFKKIESCGAQVLVHGELGYPEQLLEIYNPPAILFVRGELHDEDWPAVAVVGSRKISPYGRRAGEAIVGAIADAGVTVVSGLAFGADGLAHQVALDHGARTIAVLGNGIDSVYPAQHQGLADKILENGAIISEYLPGAEVRPENFPVRNRIVSGLSRATVVLEAAEKSGSLITAQLANEQGREMFAVPGEIFSKNAAGCNELISSGQAALLRDGEQVLRAIGVDQAPSQRQARMAVPATETESVILNLFDAQEKWHIDDLLRESGLPGAVASSTVSILEIKGYVRNLGQQMFVKISG